MTARKLLFIALATVFAGVAHAGFTQPAPVDVTLNGDGSGMASGDMVTARYAENDIELIGCGVRIYDLGGGNTFEWGFCQAEDIDGERGFCNITSQKLIDAVKSTNDYSYVVFEWDSNGECTQVGFSTQSFYIPEKAEFPGGPGRGR